MPELPEVETTLRGIEPHILGLPITNIIVREPKLRWLVPTKDLKENLTGNFFSSIKRRAKYLILNSKKGSILIHLGMSGSLRLLVNNIKPEKHDHIDIRFSNQSLLRFTDPRKFGSFHWALEPEFHPLLKDLGPEPLGNLFSGDYLFQSSRKRKTPKGLFGSCKPALERRTASHTASTANSCPTTRLAIVSSK